MCLLAGLDKDDPDRATCMSSPVCVVAPMYGVYMYRGGQFGGVTGSNAWKGCGLAPDFSDRLQARGSRRANGLSRNGNRAAFVPSRPTSLVKLFYLMTLAQHICDLLAV